MASPLSTKKSNNIIAYAVKSQGCKTLIEELHADQFPKRSHEGKVMPQRQNGYSRALWHYNGKKDGWM